jgi:hypothetical protein
MAPDCVVNSVVTSSELIDVTGNDRSKVNRCAAAGTGARIVAAIVRTPNTAGKRMASL